MLAIAAQQPPSDLPVTRLSGGAMQVPAPDRPPASGQLPPLSVTRIDDTARSADLDAPRRLSIAFAGPVPVRDVLLLLVQGTPFSIAMDPDLRGSFIGELKQLTLRQAVESVLVPRGLDFEIDGTVIRVFPRRTTTRLFDLNFLDMRRTWQRTVALRAGSDALDGTTELTASTGPSAVLDTIDSGIAAMLSADGRVHVDRRAGLAQVTDYADRLERVALYLEALHLRAAREVRLQVRILEVSLAVAGAIDWRAVRQALGLPVDAAEAGLSVVDPAALQRALAGQGDVRLLAAPDVVAMNNEPALVRAGAPDASWISLTVGPQISPDGFVQMSVSPAWSERAGAERLNGETRPVVRVSEADTVLRVAEGRTAVIAGLLRAGEAVRPAGGVTGFFGGQEKRRVHAELVVLVTPTIVTAGTQASRNGPRH